MLNVGPLENETDKIITGRYVKLFFSLGFTMEDSSIMPKITDELISNKKIPITRILEWWSWV